MTTIDDRDIEREQVEHAFGLTGGELDDQPWEPWENKGDTFEQTTFRYVYEGKPDYSDLPREDEYCTVVSCCLYGEEPEVLYERGRRWNKVASYLSSGETECPGKQDETDDVDGADERPCLLCEAQEGEDHGYIYLGDGWCETVYRATEVCPDCGGDLVSSDYDEDRCLACNPRELRVVAEGAGAYLDSDVVYEGSDLDAATRAFDLWTPRCDVELYLDGKVVEEATTYSRGKAIKAKARDLWSWADYHDSAWFWDQFRAFVAAMRQPWDDHEAEAYVQSQWDIHTGGGPESWIEYRMYYKGERVESRSALIGAGKVPPDGWKEVIGVHVWKRTGVVWHWGDAARQKEIASINPDYAAQYEKWAAK